MASVDRFSRYPHAKAYHNCDTETTIEYLKSYMKLDGIPRTLRYDQAQAFKSKTSKSKNFETSLFYKITHIIEII